MGFEVNDLHCDGVHRLQLAGELDCASVGTLAEAISRASTDSTRAIALDLRKLAFIDSSGLWTITDAKAWCHQRGYAFWLIPGAECVQSVFEVTGLIDTLPFRSDDPQKL